MCPKECNIKIEKFKLLTNSDRLIIEHLYNKQNKSYKEIGMELGKDRTTIYREVKRGLIELQNRDLSTRIEYSAVIGQLEKDKSSENKGSSLKISNDYDWSGFIEEKLIKLA